MSAKKGAKNSAKRETEGKKSPQKEEPYSVNLTLEIQEIGNMSSSETRFFMSASFMENPLKGNNGSIFEACCCGPVDVLNFVWTLPVTVKGEETIIDLSANPIVVTWSKLTTEYEEDIPQQITPDDFEVQGYTFVDLTEIITNKKEDITRIVNFQTPVATTGSELKTWPNLPFIKYRLVTSDPVLKQPSTEYNSISITLESVFNLPENFSTSDCSYQIGLVLPFSGNLSKIVKVQIGRLMKFAELPAKKLYCTLSHYDHQAKYTSCPVNPSYSRNEIEFPKEMENIPEEFPKNDEKLVGFYGIYKCMMTTTTLKSLFESKNWAVEVFAKAPGSLEHFLGLVNLVQFSYVGISHVRKLVPLRKFELNVVSKSCGHNKQVFSTAPKPKEPLKKPAHKDKHDKKSEVPNAPPVLYISNEKGYTACAAIDIEIASPIIPKQKFSVDIDELNSIHTPEAYRTRNPYTTRELEYMFESEIETFLRLIAYKISHGAPPNALFITANEADMFGAAEALLSKKFNYGAATDDEIREDILEDSYIYVINKVHDILNSSCLSSEEDVKLTCTRYICALECFELGKFIDARDFYIMNIRETQDSSEQFILLAIHSLLVGEMQVCLECCNEALSRDPKCFISYLLQAYVAFKYKNINLAEKILKNLTKSCENFVEAWIALFVIYYQADKKVEVKFTQQNISLAEKNPYTTCFHSKIEIAWEPIMTGDFRLNSIIKLIQWGCLDFAEIGLCWTMHDCGCNSYKYLYYMAVIDYYRGNYLIALQRLGGIKFENPCQQRSKYQLRIHCLLNLESLAAVNDIRKMLKMTTLSKSSKEFDIIHLKLGKFYLATKKYRAALFYLKQCLNKPSCFVAYVLLGQAYIKRQLWDQAEKCFKAAHRVNPYNDISWAYLAIIYYRTNLIPQYYLCIKNARQNRLDNKLREELEKLEATVEQRKRNKICDLKKINNIIS